MGGRMTRRADAPSSQLARPVVSLSLLVAGVVVITANLALGGGLLRVDQAIVDLEIRERFPAPIPFADWADRIGQRAVCLPLLLLLVFVIWRRYGFKRPIVIAIIGNLGLNFIVGVLKLATSRESPHTGVPEFFVGNMLYPSGHSGNVVFVYGLMAAFALRYAVVHPRRKRVLVAGVTALTVLMFIISLYRETHWLTDLVVGALLGGIALECALIADREWPAIRAIMERMLVAVLRVVAPLRSWELTSPGSSRGAARDAERVVGGVLADRDSDDPESVRAHGHAGGQDGAAGIDSSAPAHRRGRRRAPRSSRRGSPPPTAPPPDQPGSSSSSQEQRQVRTDPPAPR